jgi:hypothetical protein
VDAGGVHHAADVEQQPAEPGGRRPGGQGAQWLAA